MSVNHVFLLGRLGQDVELKESKSGHYCKVSIATNRRFKGENETAWHNVTMFGKTAELCAEFFHSGSPIGVTGRLQYGKYEKDGIVRYTMDVICEQLHFVPTTKEGGSKPKTEEKAAASWDSDDEVKF